MRYANLLFLLMTALSTTTTSYAQQPVNVQDSLALIDFYDSTNGPNWTQNRGWKTGPVDTWYGVTVTEGRVTEIRIEENYVKGRIPESFGNLTKLKSLDLNYGGISSLPQSFGNLISLQTLNMMDNALNGLPESIGNLTNLEILDVGEGHSANFYLPESLGNLKNLTYLDLSYNKLNRLPESIGNLTNLQSLVLYGAQLSTLPESIGNLGNLRNINLASNQLTSLPESIGNLTNLQSLDLSTNKLSSFAESLANLSNLANLSLSDNQLSSIPESIGNLTNLQYLSLDKNELGALPDGFGNLTKLQSLGLSNNQLISLPASFGKLTNLKFLSLSNNQLSLLPDWFGDLNSLTRLFLSNNQLSGLPATFVDLANLIQLELSGNQLSALPDWFGNLTNLTNLSVEYNQLGALPESFGNLTKLRELRLGNNQLTSLPGSIGNLTSLWYLFLENNQLSAFPESFEKVITSFYQYGRLNLNDNKLRFDELEWIVKLLNGNVHYSPQDTFKLTRKANTLIASVGGTPQYNTYYWYRNNTLDATIKEDSTFTPAHAGNYRVEVTNAVVTGLRLISETLSYNPNPVVNIKDVTVYESDGKAKVMVYIEKPANVPLRLSFKTVAGTATPHGELKDYTSRVGYVKIRAGDTSGKIRIPVRMDKLEESNETFYVVIRKKGFREDISVVGRDTALVTILDGNREPDINMASDEIIGSKPITHSAQEPQNLLVAVSPNPSKEAFRITVSNTIRESIDLRITNQLGVQVDLKRGLRAGQTILLGRSYLPGTYFLTARSGSSVSTLTLIKQ